MNISNDSSVEWVRKRMTFDDCFHVIFFKDKQVFFQELSLDFKNMRILILKFFLNGKNHGKFVFTDKSVLPNQSYVILTFKRTIHELEYVLDNVYFICKQEITRVRRQRNSFKFDSRNKRTKFRFVERSDQYRLRYGFCPV